MIPSVSRKFEVALGVAVLIALAALIWIALQIKGVGLLNASRYHFLFDNAVGLVKDNPVTIAGVKVGTVSDISVEGKLAKVSVLLDPDVAIYQNAQSAIRAKSLLGEKYISLDPGAPPSPRLAKEAVLANFVPTVDIDQVIREVGTVMARVDRWTQNIGDDAAQSALARIDRFLTKAENTLGNFDSLAKQSTPKLVQALSKADHLMSQLLKLDLKDATHVLTKLNSVLGKLDAIDEGTLRKFLQLEGVRIRLFDNAEVRQRVEALGH